MRSTETTGDLRAQVRAWLADNLPAEWRGATAARDGHAAFIEIRRRWASRLYEGGWLGLSWPEAWGGRGRSLVEEAALAEELAAARAPDFINRNGVFYIGPTLLAHGTEAQRARYLPGMLAARDVWCQGYSEPGAGSDVAALKTSALAKGDHWILAGQKLWVTLGPQARYCYALARTSSAESRHDGLTAFIVDLRSAGVQVTPIETLTRSGDFAEIFFDDVAVPKENVLGEVGGGWAVAMTTLGFERSSNFFARAAELRHEVQDVIELARQTDRGGRPAIDDGAVAERLARSLAEAEALRLTIHRYLPRWSRDRRPGPEASVIKIMWSESHQRLTRIALDILGPNAEAYPAQWAAYLNARAETIYAGTSEVQRTVIARRMLGLPRGAS